MVVLIVLGVLVGAAIVAAFAYLIVGWVGLAFVVIGTLGLGALAWYGYVLYGKASDLAYEGGVVFKKLNQLAELVAQIKVPDSALKVPDSAPTGDDTPAVADHDAQDNQVQVSP